LKVPLRPGIGPSDLAVQRGKRAREGMNVLAERLRELVAISLPAHLDSVTFDNAFLGEGQLDLLQSLTGDDLFEEGVEQLRETFLVGSPGHVAPPDKVDKVAGAPPMLLVWEPIAL
jgi:hypothetical protein